MKRELLLPVVAVALTIGAVVAAVQTAPHDADKPYAFVPADYQGPRPQPAAPAP